MSKDRSRRRAEREAAKEAARARAARAVRRKDALRPVSGPFARLARLKPRRRRRPDSVLIPRRRRQNLGLVAVLLVLNALLWTQVSDPGLRALGVFLSVIAWPVLVTVVFDRRSS